MGFLFDPGDALQSKVLITGKALRSLRNFHQNWFFGNQSCSRWHSRNLTMGEPFSILFGEFVSEQVEFIWVWRERVVCEDICQRIVGWISLLIKITRAAAIGKSSWFNSIGRFRAHTKSKSSVFGWLCMRWFSDSGLFHPMALPSPSRPCSPAISARKWRVVGRPPLQPGSDSLWHTV